VPSGSVSASGAAFGAAGRHGFGGRLFAAAADETLVAGGRYCLARMWGFV
tara:strand:+ start:285 stop:434 length:150 start_codon:yes stop_codon:yes gene_type:complete